MSTIQFKRGLTTNLPATALAGEPVFATDGEFYIGTGTGLKQISGGVSTSANKWTTSRTITHTGDVTGSVSIDGSANVSESLTLASVATAGTYKSVTVNVKGLVTSGTNPTTVAAYGITDAITTGGGQTIGGTLTVSGAITGNTSSSTKLATSRTIAISGDVTGTATGFDGTANISISATIPTLDGGTF